MKFRIIAAFITIVLINISEISMSQVHENFDQNHTVFNQLLIKYVRNGIVDYKGFISSQNLFDSYLESLGNVSSVEFDSWDEREKLAYWINCYNAFTVKAIIDHYPIKRSFTFVGLFYAPSNSILQINGVWKKLKFKAVGRDVTLDEIEHEILRKQFGEPRIHFAINCASVSCPDLRNEAYTSAKLDNQLDDASRKFVNDEFKGTMIIDNKKIKLSKIFNWFGADFLERYGDNESFKNHSNRNKGVLGFVYKYLNNGNKREILLSNKLSISYLKYDWSLNEL